jgi:non-homologous end joining protein Ku
VIDLMEALKKSLAEKQTAAALKKPPARAVPEIVPMQKKAGKKSVG